MKELASEDFDIVGFSGVINPDLHVQTAMPVVRERGHDKYHILLGDESSQFEPDIFDRRKLLQLASDKRISRLGQARSAFPTATALILSDDFRKAVFRAGKLPEANWLHTFVAADSSENRGFRIAFVAGEDIARERNLWAAELYGKVRDMLVQRIRTNAPARADEQLLIQMGLGAASDPLITDNLFLMDALSAHLSGDTKRLQTIFAAVQKHMLQPGHESAESFSADVEAVRRQLGTAPGRARSAGLH